MRILLLWSIGLAVAVAAARDSAHAIEFVPPEYNATVWEAFYAKTLLNPLPPLRGDPYADPAFNTTWTDEVCAAVYPVVEDRLRYELRTFASRAEAEAAGAHVTHLHPCGLCSTARDLAVYMQHPDLTDPVRRCGMDTLVSDAWAMDCLLDIGFSYGCAQIWMYDAIHTRERCWRPCVEDWIEGVPNNVPPNSTTLNPCLQCDEDISGPIFKVVAGRTRRDSGLLSSIHRPPDSIYDVYQYWY